MGRRRQPQILKKILLHQGGSVSMGKNKSIKYVMQRKLESQIRMGVSKRAAESKFGGQSPYLHSAATVRTYMQQVRQYGDWLSSKGLKHCTIEDARKYAPEYIKSMKSAWSQSTARSAIAKALECKSSDICTVDKREGKNIVRGRTATAKAAAIEQRHPELAEMCRSVGARHHRELANLTAKDFFKKDDDLYAHIKGKGGRVRDALVMPGVGRNLIEERIAAQPTGKLFAIPKNTNVHSWRADYAARCYKYAVDNGYTNGKLYKCRDGSGCVYDKGALDFVSKNLGHGDNRHYTVVYNYLSYGKVE